MISSEYIYLLIFVLFSRLPFYLTEEKLVIKELSVKIVIQLFPLVLLSYSVNVLLLMIIMTVVNIVEYLLEDRQTKNGKSLNSLRTIELVTLIIISSILFSISHQITFNKTAVNILTSFQSNYIITKNISSFNFNIIGIVVLGALFLLNEVNLPVRSMLGKLKVLPEVKQKSIKDELNAGRVIGMLERIIVYIFVIGGQYAALGLILAAKAYARSKRMDDQDFAEYVLIGTLISTSFALIIGLAVKYLIGL